MDTKLKMIMLNKKQAKLHIICYNVHETTKCQRMYYLQKLSSDQGRSDKGQEKVLGVMNLFIIFI